MNNYHYIIASLPALRQDHVFTSKTPEDILSELKGLCSKKDNAVIDFVLEGASTAEAYAKALKHPCRFVREYFLFDLSVKDYKVEWLNQTLGREPGTDVITLEGVDITADDATKRAFAIASLLGREKAIDNLYWDKITELSSFHYFDLEVVLAFVLKLAIIRRWFLLDEEQGRIKFRELVEEINGTFKGVPKIDK